MKDSKKKDRKERFGRQYRDGQNESIWQRVQVPVLAEDKTSAGLLQCDALIVGAGITGVTTALLLQRAGLRCVIAEAHKVGFGTTSGTSAHINTFADTTFAETEKAFDADSAQLFADAIAGSVALISENVKTYAIDCDFEWKNGYVYAETQKESKQLDDLYQSALSVKVKVSETSDVPTNVPYLKGVVFEDQAQFHPVRYLTALAQEFKSLGGVILENTPVDGIDTKDKVHAVSSGSRRITAKNVVYATHIPPGGINVLHFRNAPYRSYVIAATLLDDAYPADLIYDMQDPYHFVRTHMIEGQKYLIAGGNDHKTGHGDPEQSFADLENYVRQYYEVDQIANKWSAQYYVPADGLPYIGQLPGAADGIYTATGFNGNGMILGTVSAMVLSDLILDNKNAYADLFDPSRIKPVAGFSELVKENADVAYHFIADRFSIDEIESFSSMEPDSGSVVEYQDRKLAVYKDSDGAVYALNPVCPHAKCIVNWNGAEKSWDCPCHGARFDINGVVLTGPARRNLEKIMVKS